MNQLFTSREVKTAVVPLLISTNRRREHYYSNTLQPIHKFPFASSTYDIHNFSNLSMSQINNQNDPFLISQITQTNSSLPPQQQNTNRETSRLAIQRLQLENFKSYGGVVDVGPFHKCFSSIVGPNGSGKSNVIDAMLFVFGRRAKQLRHSKLSELLHNSASHKNVQSATVTVYFHEIIDTGDGENDYQVVPGSTFTVARRAFRNNTSKYYLNDNEVKMITVVDLLKSKGVDLDNNRFLILQGEVEQIAMMKPKAQNQHEDGLLEYLEDIIGSNRHIQAIESASTKVESLNEERGHKLNRVKAAEKERDALEGAKIEAEDYLDKEREMLTKKVSLNKANQFDLMKKIHITEGKKKQAEDKIKEFQESVEEETSKVKELEDSFNETQKQCNIAVKTLNDAKDKYLACERKDIKLREDMKAFKAKKKKLKSTIERETKRKEESLQKFEEFTREKENAEGNIENVEKKIQKVQDELDKLHEKVREKTLPFRKKLEEQQKELLPYSEKINECQKNLHISQSELRLVVEKLEAPRRELEEAKTRLQEMQNSLREADSTVNSISSDLDLAKRETEMSAQSIQNRKQAVDQISLTCTNMHRKVEEARSAKDFSSTRSRLHRSVMNAARDRRLQGVVGRLGDLASIDKRYETAISAAASANLDCIVVRTAESAQSCIQFLRQENLGRATFVILDKIEYLRNSMENWSNSPRAADGPRLFDYLRIPDHNNETALYFALRDTLLADTLEQARRMAFKPSRQNRVVTLDGELIESSGAMTGGGRGPSRYKLGTITGGVEELTPEQFQMLCDDLERKKQQLREEEEALRRDEDNRNSQARKAEELEVQRTRAVMEADSLRSRISYMTSNTIPSLEKTVNDSINSSKSRKSVDVARKEELEEKVTENEEQLSQAKAACEGLESEIAALQEKIMAAGGEKMAKGRENLEAHKKELNELHSEISRAGSRATASQKAAEKAEASITSAEKEIEKVESEAENAQVLSESLLQDAELVLKKYKEAESIHQDWEAKVEETQKEYNDKRNELKQLRREEVSLREEENNMKALFNQQTNELNVLRHQLKSILKKLEESSTLSLDIDLSPVKENEEATNGRNNQQDDEEMEDQNDETGGDKLEVQEKDQLFESDKKQLGLQIGVLETELSRLNPNVDAIADYKRKDSEYKNEVKELDSLTGDRDDARRECDTLRKARLDEFMTGFNIITMKLKELYQMITLGGDAELELVDSLDPFSEGVLFSVRPPKKSWKNISNLSGGEKTLSSLALVFALHHFKPTPLYFLDEIDAALDYKNVSIVANYVKERTKNAQFIIISLRNNMFELADRLVGIYKTYDTTKSVTVDPSAFVLPDVQCSQLSTQGEVR